MKTCDYCNKETNNPRFCSKSCAAKKTNTESIKRKITRKCTKCDSLVRNYRASMCEIHFQEKKFLDSQRAPSASLKEFWDRPSVKGKHPSWKSTQIREFNRRWNKNLINKPCANCGYSKHVELAHIKAVSSFPETAKLSDVNNPKNVIQLCRNCHWEFDHDFLNIDHLI